MKTQAAALALALLSTGCIDFWAAYGNAPSSDPGDYDPHAPRSLASSLITSPSSAAYTDDGERFALHRCKRLKDDRLVCDLAFGLTATGIDDIWPIAVFDINFDRGGRRAIRELLADRLDDLDAHAMLVRGEGRRVMIDGGRGRERFVVTLNGSRLDLGFSETASYDDVAPLAAVTLERVTLEPEFRAVASRRRRDLVAVEVWVAVEEPAVEAYNAWVLFKKQLDGRWTHRFVRTLRHNLVDVRRADPHAPAQPLVADPKPKASTPEPEPLGPLKMIPADDAARGPCETDVDCGEGQLCCTNGIGRRQCDAPTAEGGCPKRP